MSRSDYIEEQLDKLGVETNPDRLGQLCFYVDELVKWSKVYNLSGSDSFEKLVDRLVLDSALASFHLDFVCKASSFSKPLIIDVGSGNGSPGIVWAIFKEGISLKLIEKSRKKFAFLHSLTNILNLSKRVEVHNQRIEVCSPQS